MKLKFLFFVLILQAQLGVGGGVDHGNPRMSFFNMKTGFTVTLPLETKAKTEQMGLRSIFLLSDGTELRTATQFIVDRPSRQAPKPSGTICQEFLLETNDLIATWLGENCSDKKTKKQFSDFISSLRNFKSTKP